MPIHLQRRAGDPCLVGWSDSPAAELVEDHSGCRWRTVSGRHLEPFGGTTRVKGIVGEFLHAAPYVGPLG